MRPRFPERLLPRLHLPLLLMAALIPPAGGISAAEPNPAPAEPPASSETSPPVSVLATSGGDDQEVRVTLAFSREVPYRLEETRNRLRVILDEPLDERALADIELGGEILRRIRFDSGRRSSQIVFQMGPAFGAFDLTEQDHPFRLLVVFRRTGSGPSTLPPPPTAPGEAPPATGVIPGAEGAAGTEPVPGIPGGLPERLPEHRPDEVRNVVLDPGHGGEEVGAVGPAGLKEKELVLDIARRVRTVLATKGFNVALTREEDRAVPLDARTSLANYLGADLFVSIHANASRRPGARGAESYFLSYDGGDEESLALAGVENRGSAGGGSGGEVQAILWEMAQVRHLGQASRLATLMQEELNRATEVKDRGVKQAPFRVLVGATMPAVLVEVGFLTHKQEEASLSQEDYRARLASAIAAAIERYQGEESAAADGAGR